VLGDTAKGSARRARGKAGEGHAERLVHKLDTFTDQQRAAQGRLRSLIWDYYASLKAYRLKPSARRAVALRARFDRIFLRRTGFVTLDRLLKRLHANKAELLMVLERPETPLHNNGSENDIRCYVTRRKVSAGTRSDGGRDCRHAFLGLAKTCDKLGVALWDYLGSRFKVAGHILGLSQSWPVDCFGLRLSASVSASEQAMIEFKDSHFERDVILWAVRWYVAYQISYRQLEEMMAEHGVEVDHATSIAGCPSMSRCWSRNFEHASSRWVPAGEWTRPL
jgi:hypothetical protein